MQEQYEQQQDVSTTEMISRGCLVIGVYVHCIIKNSYDLFILRKITNRILFATCGEFCYFCVRVVV